MYARSKGIIVHFGFATFLLIAVLIYLFIHFNSPETATQINTGLSDLSNVVKGTPIHP